MSWDLLLWYPEKVSAQTAELQVRWDAMTLGWLVCKDVICFKISTVIMKKINLPISEISVELPMAIRSYELNVSNCAVIIVATAGLPLLGVGSSANTVMTRCVSCIHCGDVIMGAIASQITSLTIVYSTVYSDADQRKHQSSASLAFVRGIHREPVNYPHKCPGTRKMFPFDDIIMYARHWDALRPTDEYMRQSTTCVDHSWSR